jgi:hypothetical protein
MLMRLGPLKACILVRPGRWQLGVGVTVRLEADRVVQRLRRRGRSAAPAGR